MIKLALIIWFITIDGPHCENADLIHYCAKDLQSLMLHSEILDQREIKYVLMKHDEMVSDLRMLKRRLRDLQDAPFLRDCDIFQVPRPVINELLLFNRAYRQHIDNSLAIYHHDNSLRETKEEIEILYQIWDCLRDAKCDYYYVHIRRQALKKLYQMIGHEDYNKGWMPPHVPVWRFTYVRYE